MFSNFLYAQDTVRVKRPARGDDYCWLMLYTKGVYYKDSLPADALSGESKVELRMNDACPLKKKADIFVSSFEIETIENGVLQSTKVESSFLTDQQKRRIRAIPPGGFFVIRNIVLHAPDQFRKMDNLKIFVK